MITIEENKFIIITKRFIGPILLTLPLIFIGVFFGPADSSFGETLKTLTSLDNTINHIIIWDIRITRVILSFLVGSILGLAGFLIQLSTKSPLGDPNLFGIGGGVVFVPLMVIGIGISMRKAAPTSQLVLIFASLSGLIVHSLLGHPDFTQALLLSIGAFGGCLLGARLSLDIKETKLKILVTIVLMAAAVKLVIDSMGGSF